MLHHVQPGFDRFRLFQGKNDPSAQQTRTHRRDGFVEYAEETFAPFLKGIDQLQVSDGELVKSYKPLFLDG